MPFSTPSQERSVDAKIHFNPFQNRYFHSFVCFVILPASFLPLPGLFSVSVSFYECFPPAGTTVRQITKHRLHWLLGLIERKASLVRSASACLCRNGHLCPTSPHQAEEPRNLSAVDHLTRRSITLWEDSFQMRRQSRQTMSTKTHPHSRRSTGETTGEIIHEDGWKFSRAIDALLRLAGTTSEGLWNTCRGGSGKRERGLRRRRRRHRFLHNCSLCWDLWLGADWGAAFSILGILQPSVSSHSISRQWHVWLNIWVGNCFK